MKENGMDRKRVSYLDVAKGIGILLVVAGHIYGGDTFRTILYAFHVPLFIVISGMLIGYTNVKTKPMSFVLKKKFCSLMIPYIVTEIIVFPFYMIKYGYGMADLRWLAIDSLGLYNTKGIATWFLLHLFLAEILYLCLIKFIKKDWIIWLLCTSLLIVSFIKFNAHYSIVILQKSFVFVFFLMLGHQFFSKVKNWKWWTLLLVVPFALIAMWNKLVVMSEATYNNPILFVLAAVLGVTVTFSISSMLAGKTTKLKEFFIFFGKNSLFVLCTHLMITRYGIDLIWVDGPHYESITKSVCVFILVLGIEYLMIKGKNILKRRGI